MADSEPRLTPELTARLVEELARANERLDRLESALREKSMLGSLQQDAPGPAEACQSDSGKRRPRNLGAARAQRPTAPESTRSAEAQFRLGVELCQAGRFEDALDAWAKVLAVQPDNAYALANMGIVFTELERWSEARDMFMRVLNLDSSNAEAYYGLGMADAQLGNYAGAVAAWENSLKLKPDNPDARYNLALVRQRLSQQGVSAGFSAQPPVPTATVQNPSAPARERPSQPSPAPKPAVRKAPEAAPTAESVRPDDPVDERPVVSAGRTDQGREAVRLPIRARGRSWAVPALVVGLCILAIAAYLVASALHLPRFRP